MIGKIIALLAGQTVRRRSGATGRSNGSTERAEGLIAAASLRHQHAAGEPGAGGACDVAVIATGALSAENKVGCQPTAKIEPRERDSKLASTTPQKTDYFDVVIVGDADAALSS